MSSIMNNPFNIITNITAFSEESDEPIKINEYNISKYYRYVYVLCPLQNNIDTEIYKSQLLNEKFLEILDKMILYKSKVNIVKNQFHFNNLVQIESSLVIKCNKYGYELEDNILVLPIFNISFLNLQKYLDKFNETNNLKDLYDYLLINEYFMEDNSKNYKNSMTIKNMIYNLDESKYWQYIYNCNLNFTNLFKERNFNLHKYTNLDKSIKKIFSELNEVVINDNYLEEIFKFKKYIDPSDILNKQKYRLFRAEKDFDFTKTDLEKIFEKINGKNRFFLFCRLLISKKYCHLVFSPIIFTMLEAEINHYSEMIRYLLGYSWLTFYMEECIKKSCLKTNDRNIFTIDMASQLPVYTINKESFKNPYLPMMVSYDTLKPDNNINGVDINENHFHRIATLSEFRERLNIFMTNSKHCDIFSNINFANNKMAISGSVMTACLQYLHPLTQLFKTKDNPTIESILCRYFQEYYCEADVDIMIKTNDNFEFFSIVDNIYKNIFNNMKIYFTDSENPPLLKNYIKRIYIYVSKDFLENNFCNNIPFELIACNLNNDIIKTLLFPHIHKLYQDKIDKELEDFSDEEIKVLKKKYPSYFYVNYNDFVIRLSKKDESKILVESNLTNIDQDNIDILLQKIKINYEFNYGENDIYILNSYKVKISSPLLDHDLEIFPIRGDDFFSSVNLFHLPCVRTFYDGNNVYMTPSCVSAHLTFMNMNYKYVAGTKDPLEIINKYRMRGFGTYLNQREISLYIKYILKNKFWNNLYEITENNLKNCLGFIKLNHKLFHPRLYNAEYYEKMDVRYIPIDLGNELYCQQSKKSPICRNYSYIYSRYNSINLNLGNFKYQNEKTGFIIPVNPSMIEYIYEKYYKVQIDNIPFPLPPNNEDKVKKKLIFDNENNDEDNDEDWGIQNNDTWEQNWEQNTNDIDI